MGDLSEQDLTIAVHRAVATVGPPTENRIHEDDTARRYGFTGGLVPGVSVYSYMAHPVVAHFGPEFLHRGLMELQLVKPFYDRQTVSVALTAGEQERIDIAASNPAGSLCATGWAALPRKSPPPPDLAHLPDPGLPARRPLISREALEATPVLGALHERFDYDSNGAEYRAEVPETLPLYHAPNAIAPTGFLIRRANSILVENFVLPAWIHVSSHVTHFSPLSSGEEFSTSARITDLFERRGHEFLRLDVLISAGDGRPVMLVDHTAIYEPRKS